MASGLPVAGADALSSTLGLSATLYATLVFALPTVFAAGVEAPLLAWSDRHRAGRARLIALGLVGQAVAVALIASAPSPWLLAVGVALYAPCSGLSCALAEVVVVERSVAGPERALARWTMAGAFGDLATPATLLACAVMGASFRDAAVVVAVLVLLGALVVLRVHLVDSEERPEGDAASVDDEGDDVPLREAARRALKNGRLVGWLFATALVSTLLDETLAVFVVLHAGSASGDGLGEALLVACALGEIVGAALLARVVSRFAPTRVLAIAAAATAVAIVGIALVLDGRLALSLASVVGFAATPLYPLAKAQAFRALPGEGGMVAAIERLFSPLDVVLPLALAALADGVSPAATLVVIALAPCALVVATLVASRRGRESVDDGDGPITRSGP